MLWPSRMNPPTDLERADLDAFMRWCQRELMPVMAHVEGAGTADQEAQAIRERLATIGVDPREHDQRRAMWAMVLWCFNIGLLQPIMLDEPDRSTTALANLATLTGPLVVLEQLYGVRPLG